MICKNPFVKDGIPFGCGQCTPCRVNKRRMWTHRIMLESTAHEDNAFVTLTYDNENLPDNGTLVPQHLKDWQKRLRYHANIDLRFFSVGEYGEKTKRPHYHAAVFGFKGCASLDPKCACIWCKTLRASWKKGHIYNGTLTKDSASYIAGYVTKKMTDKNPMEKYKKLLDKGLEKQAKEYLKKVIEPLNGNHPEFTRMSLKPGIGTGGKGMPVIQTIQNMLETNHGCDLIAELNDVPDIIKIGGKQMLLGKYLKGILRERMGMKTQRWTETSTETITYLDENMEWAEKTETTIKKRSRNEVSEKKMQKLRQETVEEYMAYRQEADTFEKKISMKQWVIDKNKQKIRNIEKRNSYNKDKGVL
jgi:hypothetical protein